MAKLEIKYRAEGKALPPRPIRVAINGWGGSAAMKKEDGSQPQPWHCPLFAAGCMHGVELIYQYEQEDVGVEAGRLALTLLHSLLPPDLQPRSLDGSGQAAHRLWLTQ